MSVLLVDISFHFSFHIFINPNRFQWVPVIYRVIQKKRSGRICYRIIEKQVRGRCFKRCSVAKILLYIRIILCNFFRHSKFSKSRILRKMACLKSSKSLQKQGLNLQLFQIFKTMRSVFLFQAGNRKLSRKFNF